MTDYGMMLLSGVKDSVALKTDEDKKTVVEAVKAIILAESQSNK